MRQVPMALTGRIQNNDYTLCQTPSPTPAQNHNNYFINKL